jgi:xanthine/CO dehydrogenase XdhC/CoxF family maturation factor
VLHAFLERASHAGVPLVAALVIETRGSTYRKPGALMLFASDGARSGLLSGGCLEGDLQEHAGRLFVGGPAVIDRSYDSRGSDDPVWGLGLGCEGLMRVLLWRLDAEGGRNTLAGLLAAEHRREPAALALDITDGRSVLATGADSPGRSPVLSGAVDDARLRAAAMDALAHRSASLHDGVFTLAAARVPTLLLCGGGPDAEPVQRMASLLGWQVTVVDHRSAYIDAARFPGAMRVAQIDPEDPDATVALGGFDAAVVMSHHLVADGRYLAALARSRVPYVGLLGPAARRERLFAELGPAAEALRPRLRAPVGLDLGGRTPEDIALSIVAEIQAALHDRRGGPFSG